MEERSIYRNLSPLDHRYYLSNHDLFESLSDYISEEAGVRYCIRAEVALLKTHIALSLGDRPELIEAVDKIEAQVSPEEVYKEEEKTQHNIRALVNVMMSKVPEEIRHFVHMGATSVDILDTANSMKMRDVFRNVVIPLLSDMEDLLIKLSRQEAETPQVGRTHGQHAVPITLGYAFAEYVSRLGQSITEIDRLSKDLRGKLAGAVGSYNATSMITDDPLAMERMYMDFLGLKPSEYSTQMVEPEYLLRLFTETNTAFGIIANLADDLRHLQRSEISELREYFSATQVGSSTMPQKRNPWNSEHVKSLWKAFSPRIMTMYMDQISEHQRDLSNSASGRFQSDYIGGFVAAVARMNKILKGLTPDPERLKNNITLQGDLILAEPTYILLAMSGAEDGHEVVRKLTLTCDKTGRTLFDVLKNDHPDSWKLIENQYAKVTGKKAEDFYANPALYRGKTVERTYALADQYENTIQKIREGLK